MNTALIAADESFKVCAVYMMYMCGAFALLGLVYAGITLYDRHKDTKETP